MELAKPGSTDNYIVINQNRIPTKTPRHKGPKLIQFRLEGETKLSVSELEAKIVAREDSHPDPFGRQSSPMIHFTGTCVCGHQFSDHHSSKAEMPALLFERGEGYKIVEESLGGECEFYFKNGARIRTEGQCHCAWYHDVDWPKEAYCSQCSEVRALSTDPAGWRCRVCRNLIRPINMVELVNV